MRESKIPFDAETWTKLPDFFDNLPEPVRLIVWGEETGSSAEREAAVLVRTLAQRFEQIEFELLPRRINHDFYPVIGVMGEGEREAVDYGVRLIGLPTGYQMTSLVSAIQSVSFRGMTLEARTRIRLHKLATAVNLELVTSSDDEAGPIMAHKLFNMAVVSNQVRSYLIMSDDFPEVLIRYSVKYVPHLVINGRVHLSGVADDDVIIKHIAMALGSKKAKK